MLKIGITSCFLYPDPGRSVFGHKSLSYLENDMAHYLTRKNILPILIPDVRNHLLEDILDQMDGFVLQGGTDIAPESYGEQPIGIWKGDNHRDQYELKILDYAISHCKPVLGICRGFQLMNVFFGGSLYQDIHTQVPDSQVHRSAEVYDKLSHPIVFEKDRFLDKLYHKVTNPHVNTVHHQAIKGLGQNLEVYAHSEDGLIEAFGYTQEPEGKVFGIQWHPEFSHTLGDHVINPEILYDAFLNEVHNQSLNKISTIK